VGRVIPTGDTGLVGNVGERPIAIIVVQDVASILRHEKIGKAVVIVVAPDTTQAVTRTRNSSLVGHIGESAIAIIAVQRVAYRDAAVVEIAAIDEIDVLPAIAVEICYAQTRTDSSRLMEIPLFPLK
jgi:hypothetical protein